MALDYAELDPGIRDIVRLLRQHGFNTTDSGDGVSKPADARVLDMPHVAVTCSRVDMFAQADSMHALLGELWQVEASYCPNDKSVVILATAPALLPDCPGAVS